MLFKVVLMLSDDERFFTSSDRMYYEYSYLFSTLKNYKTLSSSRWIAEICIWNDSQKDNPLFWRKYFNKKHLDYMGT